MRIVALVGSSLLLGACALTSDPHPTYHPPSVTLDGERALVVGVERDPANAKTVEDLAGELAFGLAQRGRRATHLPAFLDDGQVTGRALPDPLLSKLRGGQLDADTVAWLRSEGFRHLIFLEVKLYDQAWVVDGKRTRVGLVARGRDLAGSDQAWYAHATPEVVDEPGRGFQLGSEAAVEALVRLLAGQGQPTRVPRIAVPYIPPLKVPW
jgi:hypothetical protein